MVQKKFFFCKHPRIKKSSSFLPAHRLFEGASHLSCSGVGPNRGNGGSPLLESGVTSDMRWTTP